MSLKTRLLLVFGVLAILLAPVASFAAVAPHSLTIAATSTPADSAAGPVAGALLTLGALGITIRRDTTAMAKRFADNASQRAGDYKDGVAASGQDWLNNTLKGESNFEQGVNAAIADKRFGKGVQAAGSAKFVANATTLGPQRFQTGVQQAQPAWQKGVQPHIDAMKALQLPDRGPKGSAQNQQRQQITAARNREVKLGK